MGLCGYRWPARDGRSLPAFLFVLFLGLLAALSSCSGAGGQTGRKFTCPMHPQVVSDRQGDCQICGMHLVPVEERTEAAAPATAYTCPMHPEVRSDGPASCPKCGMHLEPVSGSGPTGGLLREVVSADPELLRSLGFRSEEVRRMPLRSSLRLPARIIPDASRVRPVISRVDGFVTGLDVWSAGQRVRKGQPLLRIYSLGILSLQQQYLNSSPAYGGKRFQPPPNRTPAPLVEGATDGVDRSRLRLKDWDFSDEQIARIEKTGVAEDTLELASPASGFITAYNVVPGQRVAPGDLLLTLTDLERVWAEVDAYERDAPLLREGLPVSLEVSALPGRTFPGRVRTFLRALDPETRTSRVLVELENREGLLLPGMLATASLNLEGPEGLAVPSSAVLRTGGKDYAFREVAPGRLEPVLLALGRRGDGYIEVLGGLREGDRVAASALFFVDSESSLRAVFHQVGGTR